MTLHSESKEGTVPNLAIDIHHHYVPPEVIGEAKRHGKALGIELFKDTDGSVGFSFNGGPRYALQQGLTDVERRLKMMEQGKIALAALDPSTNSIGYHLKGEQAESWCRIYNECVKELLKKHPDRFTAMAAVPIQEPERAASTTVSLTSTDHGAVWASIELSDDGAGQYVAQRGDGIGHVTLSALGCRAECNLGVGKPLLIERSFF